MKRNGTIIVALLVMLALLGGRLGHGQARECTEPAPAASEVVHAHHHSASAADPIYRAAPFDLSCVGPLCPMNGCCFPRIAAPALETPRTASSAMPLLLATNANGTGPAEIDHPPRIS